jgi:hypothetical protein
MTPNLAAAQARNLRVAGAFDAQAILGVALDTQCEPNGHG